MQTEKLGTQKTHALESSASETLRVVPVQKRFRVVAALKGTWTDFAGSAINLHLEGNWAPLRVSPQPVEKGYNNHDRRWNDQLCRPAWRKCAIHDQGVYIVSVFIIFQCGSK